MAGVVGWTDLAAPDVAERLAGLRARPGGERLVGIRHQVHDEPDPGLARARRRRAAACARSPRPAWSTTCCCSRRHLPAAAARSREALPELALVLDHGAKPADRGGWLGAVVDRPGGARRAPNVTGKLSGLVTEAPWDGWRPRASSATPTALLEVFGPERLMCGSDWPVCTLAASYGEVLDLAARVLADSARPSGRPSSPGPPARLRAGLAG